MKRRAEQVAGVLQKEESAAKRVTAVTSLDDKIIGLKALATHKKFLRYLAKRIDQIEDLKMQSCGSQVAFGAMTSLRKLASQVRLK